MPRVKADSCPNPNISRHGPGNGAHHASKALACIQEMKIINCAQGSPEWINSRLGLVTASEIDALVTPTGEIRKGKGVDSYLYQKLTERLLGFPVGDFTSHATEHGSILETEARPWYSFDRDVTVETPGLCVSDDNKYACSPDGLVGTDGGLEIKAFQPVNSIRVLVENKIPDANIMQVHMSLFVTGRAWWDWVSYSRQWPPVVIRVHRDEAVQATIKQAVDAFAVKFDAALAKIKAMKAEANAVKQAAYDAMPAESR